MLLTNLLLLGLTILAIRMFLELNRMPYSVFSAAIMILCVIGAYGLNNSMDDVMLMFVFALIGYAMRKFDIPVAPVYPGAGAGGHGGALAGGGRCAGGREPPRLVGSRSA